MKEVKYICDSCNDERRLTPDITVYIWNPPMRIKHQPDICKECLSDNIGYSRGKYNDIQFWYNVGDNELQSIRWMNFYWGTDCDNTTVEQLSDADEIVQETWEIVSEILSDKLQQ